MNLQNTLETAGYVYNPFTQGDIWGQPAQNMFAETHAQELPVGQDDSALPSLVEPGLVQDFVAGSADPKQFKKRTFGDIQTANNTVLLIGFIAVLVGAFYWQR